MKRLPDPTFDQRVADWLEADPLLAPREVLATVLAAYPSIDQRPARRRPWRFPTMHRLALPAAAALVVVISGALLLPRLLTPPTGNPTASPTFAGTALPTTEPPTNAPLTPEASDAPRLVAFQIRTFTAPARSTVWVQAIDGGISRELLADEAGSWLLGRTSGGDQLLVALFGDGPSLALVDINTGDLQMVPAACPADPCWADYPSPFGTIGTVSLADDDRTAVMVLRDEDTGHEAIATVDLATGETTFVEGSRGVFLPGPGLWYPRLSPDGQTVAYVVGTASDPFACYSPDAGMVRVVDRFGDSDTQRELVPFSACARDPRWSASGAELLYSTAEVTRGGTASIARERNDVYRVSLTGAIERLTTDGLSSHGAWTRDGRISFLSCDSNCDQPGIEVRILDPETGERAPVGGTLAALTDAGCFECTFLLVSEHPPHNGLVVGLWPEDGNAR
jgi:hypothetical protein